MQVDALDLLSEEFSSFLNKQTGKAVHIAHADMSQIEEEVNDEDSDAEELEDTVPAWNAEALATARAVPADDQGINLSQIVVPMLHAGRLIGVLDVNSTVLARFDDEDRVGLEEVVRLLLEASDDNY